MAALAASAWLAACSAGGSETIEQDPSGGGVGASAPLEVEPETLPGFTAEGGTILLGGPHELVLSNPGGAPLPWTASVDAAWVALSKTSGTLGAGKSTSVMVSLAPAGLAGLAAGTHHATVHFSDPLGGGDTDRTITLDWAPDQTPLLTLEPIQGFNASGVVGGPFAPGSKTYVVRNVGSVPAAWAAATSVPWLTVDAPSSGVLQPGTHASAVVRLDQGAAAAFAPGVHGASILFTNATSGQVLPLPFELAITAAPGALAVGSSGFSFGAEVGSPLPAAKTLKLTNTGGQPIAWSATPNAAWLGVAPTSGSLGAGQSVNVAVSIGASALSLSPGSHQATIAVVNGTNGVGNASLPVALSLTAAPASLAVSPDEDATFSASGTGALAPPYKQYTVANTGGEPLAWSASASDPWISLSKSGGTLGPGAQTTLAVSVLGAGSLPAGIAAGTVSVVNLSNGNGSESLGVEVAATSTSSLAINLAGLSYYSPELPFVDLFRTAQEWLPQEATGFTWNTGQPLATDANGWIASLSPGQAAGTLLARDIDGQYPAGTYTLLYDGKGTFTVGLDGKIKTVEPGRILVDVTPSNAGVHLKLTSTDVADPVRNIRFVMPGHEATYATDHWNPAFLDVIEPFAALRFMDWQQTNHTTVKSWSERATLSTVTQATTKGACVELMVDLCNTAQKDAWFCMPHLADDGYVEGFATYVRDHLDPSLRVYVEFSNEVWNGIFPQAAWALAQGQAAYPGTNDFQAQLRFYSKRAVEMFDIWTAVFAGQEHRLVRTLAGQMNPWTGTEIMDWQKAYEHADAYAIAPYFGGGLGDPSQAATTAAMSVSAILDACQASLAGVLATVDQNADNAAARGLRLLAYEGGQHLVGHGGAENNTTLTAKFIDANRHPKMRDIYLDYLAGWKQAGGELFFHFNAVSTASKWGSWGALERLTADKLAAPKYSALVTFVATTPAWW